MAEPPRSTSLRPPSPPPRRWLRSPPVPSLTPGDARAGRGVPRQGIRSGFSPWQHRRPPARRGSALRRGAHSPRSQPVFKNTGVRSWGFAVTNTGAAPAGDTARRGAAPPAWPSGLLPPRELVGTIPWTGQGRAGHAARRGAGRPPLPCPDSLRLSPHLHIPSAGAFEATSGTPTVFYSPSFPFLFSGRIPGKFRLPVWAVWARF